MKNNGTVGAVFFLICCIVFSAGFVIVFLNPLKTNKPPLQLTFKGKSDVQRRTDNDRITDDQSGSINSNGVDSFGREAENKAIIAARQSISTESEQGETVTLQPDQTDLQTIDQNLQTVDVSVRRINCDQYHRPYNIRSNIDTLDRFNIVAVIPCNTDVNIVQPSITVTNNLSTWHLIKWQNRYVWISTLAFQTNSY